MERDKKYILVLLGEDNKYLYSIQFADREKLDYFIDHLEPLMCENIVKEISLRERIKMVEGNIGYFPRCGMVESYDLIEVECD